MTPARRNFGLVLLAGVFVMEGFDIAAMALAVPRLAGDLVPGAGGGLGLAPASFGWVFTALLVGLGAGGALLAPLGDRFGRRALIVGGCLGTGLATLGTAGAGSISAFVFWRLLTGLALGACLPNVSALSSELAPERLRATLMAVVSAGIPVGLSIAGLASPAIVGWAGWHGLFLVPGMFAVALAGLMMLVLAGGRPGVAGDAAGAVAATEGLRAKGVASVGDADAPKAGLPQLELFRAPWTFPFAVFAAMLACNALVLYFLNSWLPTVLPGAGLSIDDAGRVAGVANLAGLGIGIGASVLLDRWRKGATLMLLFGAMAASFATIGLTAPDPLRWTLLLMVGVGGANAGGMVLPGLAAYLFPARLLSSAVGMGVLVARLGAFAGPPLGGAMIAADVPARVFLGVAAVPALACALIALLVGRALVVRRRAEGRETAEATFA